MPKQKPGIPEEEIVNGLSVPTERVRRPLDQIVPEIQDLLTSLYVMGGDEIDKKKVSRLGFELYMDPVAIEDVVFDILEKRRELVGNPYAVVEVPDLLKVGKAIKAGSFLLDSLQKQQTKTAYDQLKRIGVQENQLETLLLGSQRQKRALRAESRILSEPVGMSGFIYRLEKQASEDGLIELEEVMGRTINLVFRQYDRHQRVRLNDFHVPEQLVHVLEDHRLGRVRYLARTALLENIEIIRLSGFNEEDS